MQILKNYGFKEGMPNDWQGTATGTTHRFTYPEQGRSGNFSVTVEYETKETGKRAYWYQDVPIDNIKKYNLSGWIKTQNIISDTGGAIIQADWRDANGGYLSTSILMNYQKGTTDWKQFHAVITPPQNAAKAKVLLVLNNCSGKVWFDNISLLDIQSVFDHPNMFLNQSEIDAIKQHVTDNSEPWKTAYDQLKDKYVHEAMNTPVQSVTFGGQIPPSGDKHDYYSGTPSQDPQRHDYNATIKVGKAVRDLGLWYALTGDINAANKARDLINAWCINPSTKMNPRFWYTGQNGQVYIELFVTMPGMFYGADLIWNYPGWNDTDKSSFKSWVVALLTNLGRKKEPNPQNFENWKIVFMSSAALITEDTGTIDWAFDYWKELIPLQVDNNPLGRMKNEWRRGKPIHYSIFAINAMIETAEIAKRQGVDLYNYNVSNTDNRGLECVLDTNVSFVINQNSWTWTKFSCKTCEPSNDNRCCSDGGSGSGTMNASCNGNCKPNYSGENYPLFELAYKFKQKSTYRNAVIKWGRPAYEIRNMGPVTLTHGLPWAT